MDASYLKQTGRTYLMKAVWIGIILATLLCLALAIILQATSGDFPQQEQELFDLFLFPWLKSRGFKHKVLSAIITFLLNTQHSALSTVSVKDWKQ
ncbi:MAG: FTR1 family protein [Nostoc sp.]|uniref:FTR1 family protein n=1 Tax=Nostoc sp. TaxID=1180 RepID=UPI002FFA545D